MTLTFQIFLRAAAKRIQGLANTKRRRTAKGLRMARIALATVGKTLRMARTASATVGKTVRKTLQMTVLATVGKSLRIARTALATVGKTVRKTLHGKNSFGKDHQESKDNHNDDERNDDQACSAPKPSGSHGGRAEAAPEKKHMAFTLAATAALSGNCGCLVPTKYYLGISTPLEQALIQGFVRYRHLALEAA